MRKRKRKAHPKHPKHFRSKEAYRKFLAYTHIHGIAQRTPKSHKERMVYIAGKRHYPKTS